MKLLVLYLTDANAQYCAELTLNVPSAWLCSLKLNQNANVFSIVIIND